MYRRYIKKALIIMLLFISTLLCSCFDSTNENIENYNEYRRDVTKASTLMPSLDNLGSYDEISFSYKHSSLVFFKAETIALYVKYLETEYHLKKEELLSKYNFLEEVVKNSNGDYIFPITQIDYKGYHFRISSNYDNSCKSFALIGYDDSNYKLAFCYFYDLDLDYIAEKDEDTYEGMKSFIEDYYNWNDIV